MRPSADPSPAPAGREALPLPARCIAVAGFGAAALFLIDSFGHLGVGRLDLALIAVGGGAVFTAGLWLFLLALQRSLAWSLALVVPYVNLIAVGLFARRYWSEGARAPIGLGTAGSLAQLLGLLGWLGSSPPLV